MTKLLLVFVFVACRRDVPEPPPPRSNPVVNAPPRVVAAPREEEERSRAAANKPVDSALREQLERVERGCLGTLSDDVRAGLGRYFYEYGEGARMRREPENDGSTVLSMSASPRSCAEGLAAYEAHDAADVEMVEAGRRFVAATTAIDATTRAAGEYYGALRFVQDDMAEGRVFHARLVEEYAAWRDAWAELGRIVEARYEVADRRLIASIGAEQASRVLVERVRMAIDAYSRWHRRGERDGEGTRLGAVDDAIAALANALASDASAFPGRTRLFLIEAQSFQTAVRRTRRPDGRWWQVLEARRLDRERVDVVNAYARLYPAG